MINKIVKLPYNWDIGLNINHWHGHVHCRFDISKLQYADYNKDPGYIRIRLTHSIIKLNVEDHWFILNTYKSINLIDYIPIMLSLIQQNNTKSIKKLNEMVRAGKSKKEIDFYLRVACNL